MSIIWRIWWFVHLCLLFFLYISLFLSLSLSLRFPAQELCLKAHTYIYIDIYWLVVSTPLKNTSQWEGLSHTLWRKNYLKPPISTYIYIHIHIHDIYTHMYALQESVMMRTIPAWQTPKHIICHDSDPKNMHVTNFWSYWYAGSTYVYDSGHQFPISASIKEVQLPFVEPCQIHWDRNGWCHF